MVTSQVTWDRMFVNMGWKSTKPKFFTCFVEVRGVKNDTQIHLHANIPICQ